MNLPNRHLLVINLSEQLHEFKEDDEEEWDGGDEAYESYGHPEYMALAAVDMFFEDINESSEDRMWSLENTDDRHTWYLGRHEVFHRSVVHELLLSAGELEKQGLTRLHAVDFQSPNLVLEVTTWDKTT